MVRNRKKYTSIRHAFTLLEMIIVMVVLGIIANFGVEMLVNSYENYIFTSVQNRLQSQSELATNQIANRLEYRIKKSAIAKKDDGTFIELVSAAPTMNATILEWVGTDREGWLGIWDSTTSLNEPTWSGFIDVGSATGAILNSPQTNTGLVNTMIQTLSDSGSSLTDAAIYSIQSDGDPLTSFGWSGALANQNGYLHPIQSTANSDEFAPKTGIGPFTQSNYITEFYKLAWTAYAVKFEDKDGDGRNELWLYYDYQPWNAQTYSTHGKSQKLVDDVTTFAFKADGDVISIQVCVSDDDLFGDGGYSVCKEKTIF